jgi:glucokinase
MLTYLRAKFQATHRVSVERVVSGRGLANIFEFLCQHPSFAGKAGAGVVSAFAAAGDLQGKVVAENSGSDPVCAAAMEVFIGAYGSEAGVCALKYLPLGGLFLAGGLTPKNLKHIATGDKGAFLVALRDKGRLTPAVLRVPIYAVLDEALGQRGAHYVAHKLLRKQHLAAAAAAAAGGAGAGAGAGGAEAGCPVASGGCPVGRCPVTGKSGAVCWPLAFLAGAAVAVAGLHAARRLK